MATITLTNPIAGTGAVAGLVAGNNTAIQTCLNGGVDNANIAAAGVANIDPLKLASGWTTYTPAWTSTGTAPVLNNGTFLGAYTQIGKTVVARVALTMGSTSTFGTGSYTFSLPVASDALESGTLGTALILDSSAGQFYPVFPITSTSTTVSFLTPSQPAVAVSNLVPMTFAVSDQVTMHVVYRAA